MLAHAMQVWPRLATQQVQPLLDLLQEELPGFEEEEFPDGANEFDGLD